MKLLFYLFIACFLSIEGTQIDVVIPTATKDIRTLEMSIKAIKEHGRDVRRVIVVSKEKLTDLAEWFPEKKFPFSKEDIADIFGVNRDFWRLGWYLQQLLKCYAPFVIPDLLEHFLCLDADVIFLKPTRFVSSDGVSLVNYGRQHVRRYFNHAKRLYPEIIRVNPVESGITDHMPMQTAILRDLFERVEAHHNGLSFWKVFLASVNTNDYRYTGASEYEIYFNFARIFHPDKIALRKLKTCWEKSLDKIHRYQQENYDYVSFHAWMVGIGSSKGQKPPKFYQSPKIDRLKQLHASQSG